MDQIKIGKYIAVKRKAAGLTQAALGADLGVSAKAVSKWERGICMPDVSLYQDLAGMLGISINEIFAGEDLEEERIVQQSEQNIIAVAKDSKTKGKRFKVIIAILCVLILAGAGAFTWYLEQSGAFMKNYVVAYKEGDPEYGIASLVGGTHSVLCAFHIDDKYKEVSIIRRVYHKGKLVDKSKELSLTNADEGDSASVDRDGLFYISYDTETGKIRMKISSQGATVGSDSNVKDSGFVKKPEECGVGSSSFADKEPLVKGRETGVMSLGVSKGELQGKSPGAYLTEEADGVQVEEENDVTYVYSFVYE